MQFCCIFWIFPTSAMQPIALKVMKKSSNRFYLTFSLTGKKIPSRLKTVFLVITSMSKSLFCQMHAPLPNLKFLCAPINKASWNKMTSFLVALLQCIVQKMHVYSWRNALWPEVLQRRLFITWLVVIRRKCFFYSSYAFDILFGVR